MVLPFSLSQGQDVTISHESLPGAALFWVEKLKASEGDHRLTRRLPRVLVVTPERMLVMEVEDSMGTSGKVKSNHHLTELVSTSSSRSTRSGEMSCVPSTKNTLSLLHMHMMTYYYYYD